MVTLVNIHCICPPDTSAAAKSSTHVYHMCLTLEEEGHDNNAAATTMCMVCNHGTLFYHMIWQHLSSVDITVINRVGPGQMEDEGDCHGCLSPSSLINFSKPYSLYWVCVPCLQAPPDLKLQDHGNA